MNIFSVLSKGNSSLREVNMSSILGYFLDPNEDHGMGNIFLEAFLRLTQTPDITKCYFSEVMVELEEQLGNGKVDIGISIPMEDNKEHWFLIENKIRPESADKNQLTNYYKSCRSDSEFADKSKEIKITVVFITPTGDHKKLLEEYDDLELQKGDDKIKMCWQNRGDGRSIQEIIQNEILKKELIGEISPINEYIRHTLKAFAMYLGEMRVTSDGSRKRNVQQTNYNDETRSIAGHEIIRRDKRKFYVFKNDEKTRARPALINIIEKEKLDIDIHDQDGNVLTTYQLGRRVWDKIASDNNDES